ncbi:RNA polymerase factor sigma-54 [Thiolapillus sp.]
MKTSLQLRLGQNLTMTPQLQQAIKLLQLSTLELKQEIQEALESNLMLEIEEDGSEDASAPTDKTTMAEPAPAQEEAEIQSSTETIPEELPVDANWEDQYDIPITRTQASSNEEHTDFLSRESNTETLQDYLHWQLNLTPFSEEDRAIATALIDGISPDGYLHASLEEIIVDMNDEEIGMEEVLTVLHRIQHFDPPGVAARNPQECLLLQLEQLPADEVVKNQAQKLLQDHFDLLTSGNEPRIRKLLRLTPEQVQAVFDLIRSLNPRPGSSISPADTHYVEPDVFVEKKDGRWLVSLNPEAMPKLRVNAEYAALVKRADNSSDNTTLKDHLQEARWFLKSLQGRNQTLLKVATRIVEVQQGFFDHGEEAMKPLILKDVAEAVEMHESTISRITTGKYMHTPKGVLEFKYFFSSHINTDNGDQASAVAIRACIRKIILAENPKKPLSDNKIAIMLADDGFKVARRTVAKYREAMAIPPSNERKRLV